MVSHRKISAAQFSTLVLMFTIGTTILIIPSGLAAYAKQDAWIAAIVGVALSIGIVFFYNYLADSLKENTLVEYSIAVMGKWLGKVFAIVFIFFSFIGATTLLYYVGNFMTTQVMPETPIQFINTLFAAIVVMGVWSGIETLARAAEILFPWFILLFLGFVIFISPEIDVKNIQPVLEADFPSIFKAAISFAGTASMTFITLMMIFPANVNNRQKAKKRFIIAALIGGSLIVIVSALSILVLNAEETARQMYPSYVLSKKINIGNFLQRLEAIMAAMWLITIYFKTTLYFYACVLGTAQMLNLREYRPLVLPFGLLLIVYSLVVYPNVAYMQTWDSTIFIPYVITIGLLLPLILLAVGKFRQKRHPN